jgi:hypothetical protein
VVEELHKILFELVVDEVCIGIQRGASVVPVVEDDHGP